MKILTITFLVGILVLNIVNARLGLQGPAGMLITIILILVLHGMSRRASGDVVLRLRGAKELHPSEAPWLYRLVEELTSRHRMAMPTLYLLPGQDDAAYIVEKNAKHPVLAVTEGLYQRQAETTLRLILTREFSRNTSLKRVTGAIAAVVAGAMMMYGLSGR
jgi:heat shock protein HtpX